MKTQEKSAQAQESLKLVLVLQDENSTSRERERAFNRLYATHDRQVLNFLAKRLRCQETAEDLRSIAFQKAYENIHKFDATEGAFSTWIYSIAKNALVDHVRKQKFEVISIDAMSEKSLENGYSEPYQIPSNFENPEQKIISEEGEEKVLNAIGSLKGRVLQELATKRFVEGLPFKTIAKEMGMEDNSTLRIQILRAKDVLQTKLK